MRSNLQEHQIIDLIREYTSALQKLEFQANNTRQTILGLLENLQEKRTEGEERVTTQPTPVSKIKKPENGNALGFKAEKKELKGITRRKIEDSLIPVKTNLKPESNEPSVPGKRKRKKGGYRLSEWDSLILNSLKENEKIMINSEFFELAGKFAGDLGLSLDENQIRGKISRSLNKLANKRGALVKLNFEGKGHAYALNSWLSSTGNLKKRYS